jgi:hypothetical protein
VARYVLPVLELAGLEITNRFGLDPSEFRKLCDGVSVGLDSDLPKVNAAMENLQSTEEKPVADEWSLFKEVAEVHNKLTVPHDPIDLTPHEAEVRRARTPEDVKTVTQRTRQLLSDALKYDREKLTGASAYVDGVRRALMAMQPPSGAPSREPEKTLPVQEQPSPGPTPSLLPGLPDPTTQSGAPGDVPSGGPGTGIGVLP